MLGFFDLTGGRGAVSLERLEQDANGDLVYTFTHPWSDGTTGMRLAPLELLEQLVALVSLPRVHLVRYAGCLAPHSTLREAIRPSRLVLPHAAEETAQAPLLGKEEHHGHLCRDPLARHGGDTSPHSGASLPDRTDRWHPDGGRLWVLRRAGRAFLLCAACGL